MPFAAAVARNLRVHCMLPRSALALLHSPRRHVCSSFLACCAGMRVLVVAADCVHADNLCYTYGRNIDKSSVVVVGNPQKALRTRRLHLARIELATFSVLG